MRELLDTAHRLLSGALRDGSIAVDATAGNGHDTLHLARCVGPGGCVVAFDVQEEALAATRRRLVKAGIEGRVRLLRAGHETIREAVPVALERAGESPDSRIDAVAVNLGYLPRGDKSLITRPETTIAALAAAAELLAEGGVITAVLYSGHPGGSEERDAVFRWAEALAPSAYRVLHYRTLNRPASPELVAVEKRASPGSG